MTSRLLSRRLASLLFASFVMSAALAIPLHAASELKGLKKDVEKAIQAGSEDEAIGLMAQIGALGTEDAIEALFLIGLKLGKTPKLYQAAGDEVAKCAGAAAFLEKRIGADVWQERVFVADIAVRIDSPEARKVLISLTADKHPNVQLSAVAALEKTMHRDAIPPLLDLLEDLMKKKRDVLYQAVLDALYMLTGQEHIIMEDWRKWWSGVGDSYDPKADAEGAGKDQKTSVKRKRRTKGAEFVGVPVDSRFATFIIDTSGTMRYVHKSDIPGLSSGDGSDGGGSSGGGQMTPDDQRLAEFWTRMEMAKRALFDVIEEIEPDTMFNIIRFDTIVDGFKKQLIPANPANKMAALKWAEGLKYKVNSTTNMQDAIEKAFQDPNTNAIYFLSDGLPSKDGKVNDPAGPILDRIFELNRFRKVKIHTFGYHPRGSGGEPYEELEEANTWLKRLAKETGGSFSELKVDPTLTPDNYEKRKRERRKKEKEEEKKEGEGEKSSNFALVYDPVLQP
ncbi:MAG: HEAT repeat domain-containing protein [Planctomycetes bacterium]|nr:HEAT repeat domain-containing protein [Planctomycetota bacterium]